MYQPHSPALISGMTYSEKYRQLTAQRAYERRVRAQGLAALVAPYVPAQRRP